MGDTASCPPGMAPGRLKRRLLRAGGLAGLPKRAVLRQDGAAPLCSPVMAKACCFCFWAPCNTALPTPRGPPSLPSVPEGALLACVLLGSPQRVVAFLSSLLAGQLMRLSTGLQPPASPTSLLTTAVGVMLTRYWLVIFFGSQG